MSEIDYEKIARESYDYLVKRGIDPHEEAPRDPAFYNFAKPTWFEKEFAARVWGEKVQRELKLNGEPQPAASDGRASEG